MYRKELFEVEVDSKVREGMAYLMNCSEIAPTSPMYYNGIKNGYEDNGMDTSYLRAALERAVYHVQHPKQEEDMNEDPDEEFEETDDFQWSF